MNEQGKELMVSAIRSAFGTVPFAGQALSEVFFEFRGRLKQNRLNKFTDLLSQFFLENQNVNIENLKTEDFSDLFESVLSRVVKSKSEEKYKRFRDVLINKILNPTNDFDNSEIYLDLITNLTEHEIKILSQHTIFDKNFETERQNIDNLKSNLISKKERLEKERKFQAQGLANSYDSCKNEIIKIETEINVWKQKQTSLNKIRTSEIYGVSNDQFLYYKQSLYSKGLLIDSGIGAIGVHPFEIMSITEFGKDFIRFIIGEKNE